MVALHGCVCVTTLAFDRNASESLALQTDHFTFYKPWISGDDDDVNPDQPLQTRHRTTPSINRGYPIRNHQQPIHSELCPQGITSTHLHQENLAAHKERIIALLNRTKPDGSRTMPVSSPGSAQTDNLQVQLTKSVTDQQNKGHETQQPGGERVTETPPPSDGNAHIATLSRASNADDQQSETQQAQRLGGEQGGDTSSEQDDFYDVIDGLAASEGFTSRADASKTVNSPERERSEASSPSDGVSNLQNEPTTPATGHQGGCGDWSFR